MSAHVSPGHPLREVFTCVVARSFERNLGWTEPEVTRYVADLLVDFVHRDRIFRLRDAQGKRLEEVGEMLLEGDVSLNATSFEREREVHKHIGDFALFWSGVYPEMLRHFRASNRRDHLVDYVEQGRKSYSIAATFDYGDFSQEAPVLRRLASDFETCVFGLNQVRRELEAFGTPEGRAVRRLMDA